MLHKLQAIALGFVVVISQLNMELYLSLEIGFNFVAKPVQSVAKKEFFWNNYKALLIFAERLEWKLFQTLQPFTDRMCNPRARKIRNLGGLFEVIRNEIGSESAVSQTPLKQPINLYKRLLGTPSDNSPCCKTVRVDFLVPQNSRWIRTKMIFLSQT